MLRLLKIVVVLVVALGAAYYFLVDGIIKAQIEHRGSQALKAPLRVDGVTFHLLPGTLTLRGIALADAQSPKQNFVEIKEVALAVSWHDLLDKKVIVNNAQIHGLHVDLARAQGGKTAAASKAPPAKTTSQTSQLNDTLRSVGDVLKQRLSGNTDPSATSITGAMIGAALKPTLDHLADGIDAVLNAPDLDSDWHILVPRITADGTLTYARTTLRFVGNITDVTPQPHWFNVVTTLDFHNAPGEPAKFLLKGDLDKRKTPQARAQFNVASLPVTQWPLISDPRLSIVIADAVANAQGSLRVIGSQLDLDTRAHFDHARLDVAQSGNDIARLASDAWRGTDKLDLHLQASGDLHNPQIKLNSSLDDKLNNALQRVQPAGGLLQSLPFFNKR